MRRQDIQLRTLARQGDVSACCEVGRRYLLGVDGFHQHLQAGIEYLTRPGVAHLPQATRVIAESLPLEAILELAQLPALLAAAQSGSASAQAKQGVWMWMRHRGAPDCARWLDAAAKAGHDGASQARFALRSEQGTTTATSFLQSGALAAEMDTAKVATIALRMALQARDVDSLAHAMRNALALTPVVTDELAELFVASVRLAEDTGQSLDGIDPQAIENCLDMRSRRGDRHASYALGRALCGIPCGPLRPESVSGSLNMRKGVATLLRAADAGNDEAWLHLYRAHSDRRLSVANPQMARFCLEKAALGGQVEAQRKLGALLLREAESLADSEQAIQWLHLAASVGDAHAAHLLQSLVLPLDGSDDHAAAAIELVRGEDPWLAVRLQLSRRFGLTKLEALCVEPADGLRPWGLVVGKNPFISQTRLSAPRAVPAVSESAMDAARHAASFFGQDRRDARAFEGDLRRRSLRQRRVFERHGLANSMFFATASSTTLDALRFGPKWAFKARKPLQLALAA